MPTVRTRRIAFDYEPADLPKHYVGGDLVMSHVVSVLSSLFPEGEDFFVRTVRNYRDDITDPELKKQVAGFIGQEAIHGREHRSLNGHLADLGYPTRRIDRMTRFSLGVGERVLPKDVQLAITAALEHYTATLAEVLLSDQRARDMMTVDEVRHLLLWHALEESEHKAVAFDVFQHVSGSHRVRSWVMHATTVGFLFAVVGETAISLVRDRDTWRKGRLRASLRRLPQSPWLTREVRRHIRDYHRRDFHPDDRDTTELIARWRAELFGAEGSLVERMQGAPAGA
jgi:predicted metal-dependent hydrolase